MSGFAIYAMLLTFGYVAYFTVMIYLDLHQKKDNKNSDEENFDISDLNDGVEEPVSISENRDQSEGGFMAYTEQQDDDGLRVVSPTGFVPTTELEQQEPEPEPEQPHTTSEELNEEGEAYMEDIDPAYQLSMVEEDFIHQLNEKHNQRKIEKTNVHDHL